MASNSFGQQFRITTWGESHGRAVGVVIDGCPAGLKISESEINEALSKRAPGSSPYTSPRKELDHAEIFSGLFEGKTTGAPISIVIFNHDADSSKYDPIRHVLRPGHAQETYLKKYGFFDHRGSGRASARETACRVAAGAVAQKLLDHYGISCFAYLTEVGDVALSGGPWDLTGIDSKPLFCPDAEICQLMEQKITEVKAAGESIGGVVAFGALNVPAGLGDPIYEKLEAKLASALLSIPASKAFEIGSGFGASSMQGSIHNQGKNAGGIVGGISTGGAIAGRVAFKPASSINKSQQAQTVTGETITFTLPEGSRHDPCVAIRAVPVTKAMVQLVLADAILLDRMAKL